MFSFFLKKITEYILLFYIKTQKENNILIVTKPLVLSLLRRKP